MISASIYDLLLQSCSLLAAFHWMLALGPWRPICFQSVLCTLWPSGLPNTGMCLVWECISSKGHWGLAKQAMALPPHWVNSSLHLRHCTHSAAPRAGDKVGIVCQRVAMQGMQSSGSPLGNSMEKGDILPIWLSLSLGVLLCLCIPHCLSSILSTSFHFSPLYWLFCSRWSISHVR